MQDTSDCSDGDDREEQEEGGSLPEEGCTCPNAKEDRRSAWQVLVDAAPLVAIIVDVVEMIFN
ncbi:hypothetical protein [Streptomyces abyssomicinicus]|uniref:hypothetical protein n=1 Tax=Streptomyces abyssomicinicus TaxID=574929 RepID=UPI00124F79C4|nr:hypothetical protein [Streptomyces abyssomicinicus]